MITLAPNLGILTTNILSLKKIITLLFITGLVSFTSLAQQEPVNDSTKSKKERTNRESIPPVLEIGIGTLSYFGELNNANALTTPLISRFGYHMSFKQPINYFLEFDINAFGGQISANERSVDRNLNFESTIFSAGLGITYNFGNFLKPDRVFEPQLGVGFNVVTFDSKTDLLSEDNVRYHYWSDGSIRNLPESASNSDLAIRIDRDYYYETDIKNSDFYDLDDYNTFTFSIPVKLGGELHIGDKWDFRAAMTYHFMFTDLVDGVDQNSGNF